MGLSWGHMKWVVAVLLAAGAARAGAVDIIVLRSADLPAYDQAVRGFQKSLSLQGVDANVSIETLSKNPVDAKALLESIDKKAPAAVLAVGSVAAQMARAHVRSAPVLFCMVMESGSDLSYGGVSLALPMSEYVSWIAKSLPGTRRVGVIYHPGHAAKGFAQEVAALEKKGVMIPVTATSPGEVSRALKGLHGRVDCLLLLPDMVLFPPSTLAAFLTQSIGDGIPVVGVSPSFVKAGAIAAFFADYEDNGEQAARAAARLIRGGESLEKIPLLMPTKVAVSLNMAIARHMNRTIADDAFRIAMDVVR